jgi:hypothetical protein
MRVYVATSFKNIPEARAVMKALTEAGHTVTHDWTLEQVDPSWAPERQAAYLQECGAADYEGVRRADALVLLNHAESRDAMTEFGIALGAGIPAFVCRADRRMSVFFHRAYRLCNSTAELLRELENLSRSAARIS